jgi:O-succinylhomoserine sulfhydrylase
LFGGVVSFEVKGDMSTAWGCIDETKLLSITGNFGDAKSTITHPATTTHGKMTPEARALAGIKDNLIRVSVGLEDYQDIKQDLAQALSQLLCVRR